MCNSDTGNNLRPFKLCLMQAKSGEIVLIHVKRIKFVSLIDSSLSKLLIVPCVVGIWFSPLMLVVSKITAERDLKYCLEAACNIGWELAHSFGYKASFLIHDVPEALQGKHPSTGSTYVNRVRSALLLEARCYLEKVLTWFPHFCSEVLFGLISHLE